MPKKTKKEKLLAIYHKKLRLLENREVVTSSTQIKTSISVASPAFSNKAKPEIVEPVNQYFFSDLKKSLLLIVLILGVEVSLYFVKLIK
jgi:hypothetical protein